MIHHLYKILLLSISKVVILFLDQETFSEFLDLLLDGDPFSLIHLEFLVE